MKRKLIISFAIVALCSVAVNIFVTSSTAQSGGVDLTNVEALSICEVSSNASQNTGYCTKLAGTNIEVCVERGDPACVRCNGTILL